MKKITNPRYQAFVDIGGNFGSGWEYQNFIQRNMREFAESIGETHSPLHPLPMTDDRSAAFTAFLQAKASDKS